jgi:hypothetical protein
VAGIAAPPLPEARGDAGREPSRSGSPSSQGVCMCSPAASAVALHWGGPACTSRPRGPSLLRGGEGGRVIVSCLLPAVYVILLLFFMYVRLALFVCLLACLVYVWTRITFTHCCLGSVYLYKYYTNEVIIRHNIQRLIAVVGLLDNRCMCCVG